MRVYIAGPITGIADDNRPAFYAAADQLRAAGHRPINPHELTESWWFDQHGYGYHSGQPLCPDDYRGILANDITHLATCRAITLLPGWDQSKGAQAELAYALACGIDVVTLAMEPMSMDGLTVILDGVNK